MLKEILVVRVRAFLEFTEASGVPLHVMPLKLSGHNEPTMPALLLRAHWITLEQVLTLTWGHWLGYCCQNWLL